MDLFSLKNKRALVTGSSMGIGFAIAEGLGKAGATVILNARNAKRLEQARAALRRKRLKAFAYAFDVTDEAMVEQGVRDIENEVGAIDILVNNAGINRRAPLEEFPVEQWHELMNVNLHAVFYVSKTAARRMIRRQRGKIINIGSLLAERARASIAPYAASKAAIKMFTKAMAVEWARYNIQINSIGPGYFITEMNRPLVRDKKFSAWVKEKTPARRWGEPRELVGAAVFFASKASDFVTGQTLYVDGGWLAQI